MTYKEAEHLYLAKPHIDKGYTLQFIGNTNISKIRQAINQELHDGIFKQVNGFLQCDTGTFLMLEFWTTDIQLIFKVSKQFADKIKFKLEYK